jgi:hypothetical protein
MKLLLALILAITLNTGFADTISTVSERADLIANLEKNQEEGLKKINEAQKDGTKYNDTSYIVVIKKNGDSYERLAHFKEDKITKKVEESLLNVIHNAENALVKANPGAFSFSTSAAPDQNQTHAVISKIHDLLVFNILPSKEEADAFLKKISAPTTTEEKKPEKSEVTASAPEKPETAASPTTEKKPEQQSEAKKDEKTLDTKKEVETNNKA